MREMKLNPTYVVAALLVLLMVVTRGNHFGSAVQLPDASLAVFFLAGFYLRSKSFLVMLMLLASGSDYVSITYGGTSDWCVTPTYMLLFPAYAALWYGGRWSSTQQATTWKTLWLCVGALFLTTNIAFQLTSGGFYFFSGRFPEPTWAEYGLRIVKYYPSYLAYAFFYSVSAAFVHAVVLMLITRRKQDDDQEVGRI